MSFIASAMSFQFGRIIIQVICFCISTSLDAINSEASLIKAIFRPVQKQPSQDINLENDTRIVLLCRVII